MKRNERESIEQQLLVEYLTWKRIGFFAVPNQGTRNKAYAVRLQKEGVRAGAPDLVLTRLAPDGRPIAIEMKDPQNGTVSDAQKIVHEEMEREGWRLIVAWGFDDAKKQVEQILSCPSSLPVVEVPSWPMRT